jgi:putative transposase
VVHRASFQDGAGAWLLLAKMWQNFPRLKKIWADSRYSSLEEGLAEKFDCELEIVRRRPEAKGFEVQPKRWIVERTFGWLGRYRRLSKDDEERTASSEAMIFLAMSHLMVRRLRPA